MPNQVRSLKSDGGFGDPKVGTVFPYGSFDGVLALSTVESLPVGQQWATAAQPSRKRTRSLNRRVAQLAVLAEQFPIYFSHLYTRALNHAKGKFNTTATNQQPVAREVEGELTSQEEQLATQVQRHSRKRRRLEVGGTSQVQRWHDKAKATRKT